MWLTPAIGRTPTSATSEQVIDIKGPGWHGDNPNSKYTYVDHGETKEAPSSLNVVIIPNVNLPKVCQKASTTLQKYELGRRVANCARCVTGAPREVQQVWQGRVLDVQSVAVTVDRL